MYDLVRSAKCVDMNGKKYKKKLSASFTVEAAFVVPISILVLMLGLHIAYELQDEVISEAKKEPSVQELDPVEEIYKGKRWEILYED